MGDPTDPDEGDLSAAPETPDSFEALLADAVAAPASVPALAPGTEVSGRYTIERLLGVGGMGAVYLGRDRVLSRPVALKLHRHAAGAARLHREAIAMAQLAHPNVVTVYEAGTFEGRPFVAMEYVEGVTMRAWLERPRRAHEIVDVLLAAGEGLVAAHAVGLVHRDIKPDNILIGDDARVRVGDFGLAQVSSDRTAPLRIPIASDTATGTVVGTPAYMAPEQIDGSGVDARTDQFAFCVVAWEALAGVRPFSGADTGAMRAAIGSSAPAGRETLPSRYRRVLMRGLEDDPARRWPSLSALLSALRSARRRPRVLAAATTAGVLACAGVAYAAWPAHDPVAACEDVASTFDLEVPPAVQAAFVGRVESTASPRAQSHAGIVRKILDGHRAAARSVTQGACIARAQRDWSGELAQASGQCLALHAHTLRELIGGFSVEPGTLVDLQQSLAAVPHPDACGDARVLAGWRSFSSDPAQTRAIAVARGQVEAALTQLEAGRVTAAAQIADAVRASSVATEPAMAPRLELLLGALEIARGQYDAAERRLGAAYFAARAADDGELVLRTVEELIKLAAEVRRAASAEERWIQNGIADAERERVRYPQAAAGVYLRAASAATLADQPQLALDRAARAEAILQDSGHTFTRSYLLGLRRDAFAALGKLDDAIAASTEYLELAVRTGSEQHVKHAEGLTDHAALLLEAGRQDEAMTAIKAAKKIIDAEAQAPSVSVAAVLVTFGALLLNGGNAEVARPYLEQARKAYVAAYGEHHPDVALVDTNLALVYLDAGETTHAVAMLRSAASIHERVLGPDHAELATTLYNLAVAERQAGDLDAALAATRRCLAIFAKAQPGSPRHAAAATHVAMVENLAKRPAAALAAAEAALAIPRAEVQPADVAWAQLEAARALISLRRDPARTRSLLDEARAAYTLAENTDRVAEIDALRATIR